MAKKRHFGQIMPGKRKGSWRVRWRENGRVRQKTIAGSKSLAARFLAKKQTTLAEEEALGHGAIEPVPFERLVERYEDLFHGEKAPPTVIREASYMRAKMLPFFKGMEIGRVGRADIERFLMKRVAEDDISPSTRNKMLNILSRFFQKAVALNHARSNPVAGIKRQQEPLKPVPFVPVDTQQALIEATDGSLRSLVALLLDSGLRMGEALRLEWRDVDKLRGIVAVRHSKNKTGREAPFTSRGLAALEAAQQRRFTGDETPRVRDLVFPELVEYAATGEARLRTTARKLWEHARTKIGLPHLRIHDLRHVWAVTCVRAGIRLSELRELGGWRSLHMVLRYSRHVPENTPALAQARLESFLETGEQGHARGHGSGA